LVVFDDAGRVLTTASTAFDVGKHWTVAPRYGFLCDFSPDRTDAEDTLRQMAKYHINGVQFYDWQYRHDHLLPPEETFIDPLGRRLSLATTRALIEAAHRRGMAAMPYAAVYAASPAFFQAHQDWALFDEDGDPYIFGDEFLYIMDPAPGSPWTEHLLRQFETVLRRMDFDGIHLDQYGEPRSGFDAVGCPVDLAQALPAFINRVKGLATAVKPGAAASSTTVYEAAVVFNAVKSWPLRTVAGADQDFVYIEVWPPRTTYLDLREVVLEAKQLSGGKPVVIAAYISPTDNLHGVLLADAILFAHGAAHIELGEGNGMLAGPYFPNWEAMSPQVAQAVRAYYDFAVRYENLLYESVDNTPELTDRFCLEDVPTNLEHLSSPRQSGVSEAASEHHSGTVWIIGQQKPGYQMIHLINLVGVSTVEWTETVQTRPVLLKDLQARYYDSRQVNRIWLASPDFTTPQAMPLDFEPGWDSRGDYVEFTLPQLEYWDLVVIEFSS
jgi:dextranase